MKNYLTPDWLMVVITTVYVIATILICIFNWKSANAAREQTEQMRLQLIHSTRPIVTVEIVFLQKCFWGLRFTNHGAETAFNAILTLNGEFVDNLPEGKFRQLVKEESSKVRTIGVQQHYDLFFGTSDGIRKINSLPTIKGRINYRGMNNAIFVEDFIIELENYATFYSVEDDMEKLENELKKQNRELGKIQKTLERLVYREAPAIEEEDNTGKTLTE